MTIKQDTGEVRCCEKCRYLGLPEAFGSPHSKCPCHAPNTEVMGSGIGTKTLDNDAKEMFDKGFEASNTEASCAEIPDHPSYCHGCTLCHPLRQLLVSGREANNLLKREGSFLSPSLEKRILEITNEYASDGSLIPLRDAIRSLIHTEREKAREEERDKHLSDADVAYESGRNHGRNEIIKKYGIQQ